MHSPVLGEMTWPERKGSAVVFGAVGRRRWPDTKKRMEESVALADYAFINQLASALSIELQERVEKGADVR